MGIEDELRAIEQETSKHDKEMCIKLDEEYKQKEEFDKLRCRIDKAVSQSSGMPGFQKAVVEEKLKKLQEQIKLQYPKAYAEAARREAEMCEAGNRAYENRYSDSNSGGGAG